MRRVIPVVRSAILGVQLIVFTFCIAGASHAQPYPARPIRVVTAAAGGGIDFTARLLAHGISERLNQRLIVDNRGGMNIAAQTAAKATPDGYTLLVHNNTAWVKPLLEDVPYDHEKELAPIYGMWAPAKTPRGIIARLNQEAVRTLQTAEVKERFFASGVEAIGSTPEQFTDAIRAESARLVQVIKSAGIRSQ